MRDKLVDIRIKNQLTQRQVASMLGISEVFVRKIEKGIRNPGRATMLKFEKLYSTSERELFPDLFFIDSDTKCIKRVN